jgi:hypothetical protein
MIRKNPKVWKAAITRYLFWMGCLMTVAALLWIVVDIIKGNLDRYTWFSRLVAGGIFLALSAMIHNEDNERLPPKQ